MKYKDPLQAKIEARALHIVAYNLNQDSAIGLLMLEENLFYDEVVARWQQAINTLKQIGERND